VQHPPETGGGGGGAGPRATGGFHRHERVLPVPHLRPGLLAGEPLRRHEGAHRAVAVHVPRGSATALSIQDQVVKDQKNNLRKEDKSPD